MFHKPNPSSGIPIYRQLMDQITHAIETGAVRPGDQLPGIRTLAEQLVINPNTVVKALRELEHAGIVEIRHGAGVFVTQKKNYETQSTKIITAQPIAKKFLQKLREQGLDEEEIRRLIQSELIDSQHEKKHS